MRGYTPMKASNSICRVIKGLEKLELRVYADAVGILTIGYGHAILSGKDKNLELVGCDRKTITFDQAEALFELDRKDREIELCEILKNVEVSQVQFDALFSFMFNLGTKRLRESTLLKKLIQKDILGAGNEFSRWVYGSVKGKMTPLAGLVKRREIEKNIFLGDTQPMQITRTTLSAALQYEVQTYLISYAQNLFDEKRIKLELTR